jgi:hypothetical protein
VLPIVTIYLLDLTLVTVNLHLYVLNPSDRFDEAPKSATGIGMTMPRP